MGGFAAQPRLPPRARGFARAACQMAPHSRPWQQPLDFPLKGRCHVPKHRTASTASNVGGQGGGPIAQYICASIGIYSGLLPIAIAPPPSSSSLLRALLPTVSCQPLHVHPATPTDIWNYSVRAAERLGDYPGQLHEILTTVRPPGPLARGSWHGLGVLRGGPSLAPGPLGSVAGEPDRLSVDKAMLRFTLIRPARQPALRHQI
jgi:hypothetical protein